MRALLFAMAAGVALSGCQSAQTVASVCKDIDRDHQAFTAIAAIPGLVKPSVVKIEAAAYQSTVPICADPDDVTIVDAITLAVNAYANIKEALAEAKAAK